MKRDGTPTRLIDVVYLRTRSFRTTWRVTEFILLWAISIQQGMENRTTEKVAADWSIVERTAYRRLNEFREAFPDEENPDRIAQELADGMPTKLSAGDVMLVLVPKTLAGSVAA
jgi:hypothetical protein